jgi:hypothetical protein
MFANPYASNVLVPAVHERLVADIDKIAQDAAIAKEWIWSPIADTCGPQEVAWVKRFAFHSQEGTYGLCYTGNNLMVADKMAAVAGALVRNFKRARLFTVNQVLDMLKDGQEPDCSCLLIPNFFFQKSEGGHMSPWDTASLYDLLTARQLMGVQTVIYCSDVNALGKEYGLAFRSHVQNCFKVVELA